ncbi:MAG: phage tail protein [Thermoanaerobaculia bacterium]
MSYRFSTAAQWKTCLFEGADPAFAGLRAFAPFAASPALFATRGGRAPAVTRAGEILWHDDAGTLHRLTVCADAPESSPAPAPIARAARMIATSRGLWVASDRTLFLFEEDTLSRLLAVELEAQIHDIAAGGRGGVFALFERGVRAVDCAGRAGALIAFQGIARPEAFVFLRRAERFVVLAGEGLHWFAARGGPPLFSIRVGAMRPCFSAHVLGSDSNGRVFVVGADDTSFGGEAHVLSFDGDGNRLADIPLDPLDAPATGVVAARDGLIVTGRRGLLRFTAAPTVPDEAGEVRCIVVTPMLQAPDREDARRWLRVEASSKLPAGSTIEISYAATDDSEVRDRLSGVAADASLSPSQRIHQLLSEADLWRTPIVFHGSDPQRDDPPPFAAPLFEVRERYLWVSIALSAAPGARLPELPELAVLYPGRTLMENLPAIYQRAEAQPGSFLRALVGVLEATTGNLDGRIALMGSRIHPSTAPEEWLDFVARWLGVPWDDGLSPEQKQAIVRHAPELALGRGTRAGLEALLESLIPGTPRRFRVTDATADFGFAIAGNALPAMLGGFTRWSAELDSQAVLGFMRLPCAGQVDDGTWRLAGKVRVEVAASAEERGAWEPWLLALITGMVPLTAHVELRFVGPQALRGNRLDGALTLESPPAPLLGSGAVTGLVRLPERGARLSATGPDIGTRLR